MAMANAQEKSCEHALLKIKQFIKSPSPFNNGEGLAASLEPCVLEGNAEAENYLGMLYLKGIGVQKDPSKAFSYFSKAADKAYPKAQYNLGRLYKYGIGCTIDFTKAMDWFVIATENGNQRAAYSLGYMYYKGFGVAQSYKEAVYWFERSEDPMAKHFLGLCYYLGYGVTANSNTALELLLNNPIVNSKTLVTYIKANQKATIESNVEIALNNNEVVEEAIEDFTEKAAVSNQIIEKEELLQNWRGKLIQYDWSGKHVQRILPIALSFKKAGKYLTVNTIFEKQEKQSKAMWKDQTMYLENLTFSLDKLYTSNPEKLTLDYSLLAMNLNKQEFNGLPYLTGNVDSYIDEWTEYGEPLSIILQPENSDTYFDEETLLALANQEGQFIKLYPMPFKEQLLVQYTLEEAGEVQVALTSYDNSIHLVLDTGVKAAGEQTLQLSPDIPSGIYIVKIIAADKVHTKMIVKND